MADINNKQNVSLGNEKVSGIVFYAPAGTALPTDPTAELPDGWVNVGYISSNGVTKGHNVTTTTVTAFGGDRVIDKISADAVTFQFEMLEIKPDNYKLIYGDQSVTTDSNGNTVINEAHLDSTPKRLLTRVVLDDGRQMIQIVPNATLSGIGNQQVQSTAAIGQQVTFAANPSTELDSNANVRTIITKAATTAAAPASK